MKIKKTQNQKKRPFVWVDCTRLLRAHTHECHQTTAWHMWQHWPAGATAYWRFFKPKSSSRPSSMSSSLSSSSVSSSLVLPLSDDELELCNELSCVDVFEFDAAKP